MKRRWAILAGIVFILLAAVGLAVEGFYRLRLAALNGLPGPPPTELLSETLVQVAWVEFEGLGPIAVQRISSVRFAAELAFNGLGGWREAAPGMRLTAFCARGIIQDRAVGPTGSIAFNLDLASLSIWMSRNWSTEEIVACALNGGYYGQGRMGIETAASGYFGKPAADLAHDEVALLMVALRAPSKFEPYCDPSALADDVGKLLTLLEMEAARSDPAPVITRRLSNEVWFGGRIRCVLPRDITGNG